MPYKRSYRRKRKSRKKKKNSLSKKVSKLSKFVYKTIEAKDQDFQNNFSTFNQLAWRSQALCKFNPIEIIPGTPINPNGPHNAQRIGNQITLSSSIRCSLYVEGLNTNDIIRVIAVQWGSKSLVSPTTDPTLFLQHSNTEFDCLTSPYKIGSTEKFRILKDITLTPSNTKTVILKTFHIKGYNNLITYPANVSAAASASPDQNSIVIYLYCNNDSLTVAPRATLSHRLKYRDA